MMKTQTRITNDPMIKLFNAQNKGRSMKFNTISNLTLTIACLATYAANPLRGDETVTDIGSRLELLVDDHLIQEMRCNCRRHSDGH